MRRRIDTRLIALLCLAACGGDPDIGPDDGDGAQPPPSFSDTLEEPDGQVDEDVPPAVDATGVLEVSDVTGPEDVGDTVGDADTEEVEGDDTGESSDVEDTTEPIDSIAIDDVADTEPGVQASSCDGLDNGAPCEDGDLCTVADTCLIGACQPGTPMACDGQGPCRVGTCDPNQGTCSYENALEDAPCDDSDACTATSLCQDGLCVVTEALVCPDQGPCQVVSCDSAVGCEYEHLADDLACDAPCHDVAACQDGQCVGDPTAIPPCPPTDEPCIEAFLCDPATGACTIMIPIDAGATCDADTDACTLEACDGDGACVAYAEEVCEFEGNIDPCWDYACDPDAGCLKTEWNPSDACPGPVCGDSYCLPGETCFECPGDCGDCCGDGSCTLTYEESCDNCGQDCGLCCGNGQCDFGETCFDCPGDCGLCCGDGVCTSEHAETCLGCPSDCGECCGNGTCDVELGENCFGCPGDCGDCCGNGQCDFGETCLTCEGDCGECCTSGGCNPELGDNCQTCPEHCGACCGNGTCDEIYVEDCAVCASDCGECCGDGLCDPTVGETCGYCPEDCGSCCGNGLCDPGEDCAACPGDCGLCACGNGMCCAGETCESCQGDCGACPEPGGVLDACGAGAVEGIQRDCGWTLAGEQPCTPGGAITIACHGEGNCNLGSCDGDAMLRICDGEGTACASAQAVAQNDNACGSSCPYLTFLCPMSGQVSVLTAPHVDGEPFICTWSTYPETADATLPCTEPTCGAERDCGWSRSAVMPCAPGVPLEIGCGSGAGCGLGTSTGDPMVRVCAGDHVTSDSGNALASGDDASGCGVAPGASFTCPPEGVVTVLTAPKCSNSPLYSCELCAACPTCTPPW